MFLFFLPVLAAGAPLSQPYIAFRTNHSFVKGAPDTSKLERPFQYDEKGTHCGIHLDLKTSKQNSKEPIKSPPVIYNLYTSLGPAKQIVYQSYHEHLHVLNPHIRILQEPHEFPLLYETSIFLTSPLVYDFNSDGVLDILSSDYHGGLSVVSRDYRHHFQVPRLYVRKDWVSSRIDQVLNVETNNTDPFHSYFEFDSSTTRKQTLIRGESASVLNQDHTQHSERMERQSRRLLERNMTAVLHRRLQEIQEIEQTQFGGGDVLHHPDMDDDDIPELEEFEEELPDGADPGDHLDEEHEDEDIPPNYDDYNGFYDDAYAKYGYGDDMYNDGAESNEQYDEKHYIRIPPHVLADPVVAELPKIYGDESEDVLFVPVSYYLDEDEYEGHVHRRFENTDAGDETEVQRGSFMASAIMAYSGNRWSSQIHLDLSTDFTSPENVTVVGGVPIHADNSRRIAMCLASPTVAALNNTNNEYDLIVPTSMGTIYVFDARNTHTQRPGWPISLEFPIEQPILVENVMGDSKLEMFVADTQSNVLCLSSSGERLWHRTLAAAFGDVEVRATSPLSLGDVDGDGQIDLVQTIMLNDRTLVFAMDTKTGKNLPQYPIELDGSIRFPEHTEDLHQKLPQPLLVNLQKEGIGSVYNYIAGQYSNSAALHVVQPHGDDIFMIHSKTGCTQKISIGEPVSSVTVDDVYATNSLDLVVTTEVGNVVTLSTGVPFHPLNTFQNSIHKYSATQSIHVHTLSRRFTDVFGVYVTVTFEIHDKNARGSSSSESYTVNIRDGSSASRTLFRETYNSTGVKTAKVYVRYGPGYYNLGVYLFAGGKVFEDRFSIGYNVGFLDGLGILLWLPLVLSAIAILLCGARRKDDLAEDISAEDRETGIHKLGILGKALPK